MKTIMELREENNQLRRELNSVRFMLAAVIKTAGGSIRISDSDLVTLSPDTVIYSMPDPEHNQRIYKIIE